MSTQAETRQKFISYNRGKKRAFHKGYWYKCAHCGKWCGRPGEERAVIPDDCKMEVDHIKPWSLGGSDEIWNLQPLCKPCNRKKSADITSKDKLKILKNDIIHADGIKSCGKRMFRQSKTMKALGLNERK